MGLWKTIDDETKTEKSLVRIVESGGVLGGKIEKLLDPAKQNDVCDKCSDERKGKPIVGLRSSATPKRMAKDKSVWTGGEILDPNNGRPTACGPAAGRRQKLEVRGYVGPFFRNQTWIRSGVSNMNRFNVRKVAVLGAGVMGAQIAAHLVNVKVPVVLFRSAGQGRAEERHRHQGDRRSEEAQKARAAGHSEDAALIEQANHEETPRQAQECDLIIEAIAERMDWKLDLYKRIAPAVAPHAIVANTSGLSITKLAEALPEEIRPRFCGIHFFNPPRYMYLVELIHADDAAEIPRPAREPSSRGTVGKNVVRADTPNFIANRVGIAGMLATMKPGRGLPRLSYDVVDDLTGKKLGRASSGTFRTMPTWWGLDTMAHVIKTLQDNLPTTRSSPATARRCSPAAGSSRALGQKTAPVSTRRSAATSCAWIPPRATTCPLAGKADESSSACRRRRRPSGLKLLRIDQPAGAVPVISCATVSTTRRCTWPTSPTARAMSTSRCAGLRHEQGPVRAVAAGLLEAGAEWVKVDIDAGKALCPRRCRPGCSDGRDGVHTAEGPWSP